MPFSKRPSAGLRVTGVAHILLLTAIASLTPDRLSWWVYGIVGAIWLTLITISVKLTQGYKIAADVMTLFHCLLFIGIIAAICYSVFSTATIEHDEPHSGGFEEALIFLYIIPVGLVMLAVSGITVAWMFRLRRRFRGQ